MNYRVPDRQKYPASYYVKKQPVRKVIDINKFVAKRTGPVVAVRGSTGISFVPLPVNDPVRTLPRRNVRNCPTCGNKRRNVFCPNCA